ncbi:MAG: AMP-binding protein [Bacteroidetes bacterium]|nr:AMP-binding protein [Bacteroidota bacterium]
MNTTDYLLNNSNDNGLAFITKNATVTYCSFKRICARLIHELNNEKIEPGNRVAIWGVNSPYWAAAYLAILKIGAVAVPVSTLLSADSFKRNMTFADCKYLFVDKSLYTRFVSCCEEFPYFILDDTLLKTGDLDWDVPDPNFDTELDAALMFTSGTTGQPRAVRITHRNIQANTESIIKYLDLNSEERMMVILPFFYCYGASLLHTHLRVGATLVLSNSFTYSETVIDLMETTKCTGFAGVPSTYHTLLRNSTFPVRSLPNLKIFQQAGGKLYDSLLRELINSYPLAKIYVMYGQTEATARLSYLPPELLNSKLGSIGRGIPGVSLSVVREEDGEYVQAGEIGEIVASGDNISPGYYNDKEATQEKFSNGMLFTGDMATVDEQGFIYIVDRKSDFIKSYGYRVSSYEVEACVMQIPNVVAAAAVGFPDEQAGELIKVFVILCDGSTLKSTEIMDFCHVHLARHMWPQEIIITKSFPVNSHGKVTKSELRKYEIG